MPDFDELDALATESVDPRYADIDQLSVAELASLMNEADAEVPAAVRRALPQIVPAIEAVVDRMRRGGRLIYIGAGTSGRLGVLDASEIPPTFSAAPGQVQAIIAGGRQATWAAVEGAEDDEDAGVAAIDAASVGPLDSVIGLASSGRTPFVLAGVRRASALGALTVGLSCNAGTALSGVADHAIEVIVGPEVVSGSTRLKAGTAQKLVLNMVSTIAMVQLGKTYGNLMVDLDATNDKLRDRAVRIVTRIAGVPRSRAVAALISTDYEVKTAIVVLAKGLTVDQARAALTRAGGQLRAVIDSDDHPRALAVDNAEISGHAAGKEGA